MCFFRVLCEKKINGVIQAILEASAAAVNVYDAGGSTPLDWAYVDGFFDVAQYLLRRMQS